MTIPELMTIIVILCGDISLKNPKELIMDCREYYVNCSIGFNGKILDKRDFLEICNYKTKTCKPGDCGK